MVTNPTVFILGAGASSPYGFPLGQVLWQELCAGLLSGELHDSLIALNFSNKQILDFREDLFRSGLTSVDSFLEHRKEFTDIGKIAIAFSLMRREKEQNLFADGQGAWYKYLFGKMKPLKFEEFCNNKVSIITYNYDRSIEHFLFTSLQRTFGRIDFECADQMNRIPIIHLHGRLSKLPWQGDKGRPYGFNPRNIDTVVDSSKGIKIIHETEHIKDDEFEQALKELKNASRVYILGFGFNEVNVKRLKFEEWSIGKIVSATTVGFVLNELDPVRKMCGKGVKLHADPLDSLDLLRNVANWD